MCDCVCETGICSPPMSVYVIREDVCVSPFKRLCVFVGYCLYVSVYTESVFREALRDHSPLKEREPGAKALRLDHVM